jgi:dihydropteroate synthase
LSFVVNSPLKPDGLPAGLASLDRCLVMGIINVTPDSFSDGGRWLDSSTAIEHGLSLIDQGADLVDVGGESTRPGADRIPADEELRRVIPVIQELSHQGIPVSIDTMRASVAQAAVEAGACIINDVSGGAADPLMYSAVAESGLPYIAMHWRGFSHEMERLTHYDDVVVDVIGELMVRIEAAVQQGVDTRRIVIDPGLGFAKKMHHNWEILRGIDQFTAVGHPVLIGAARKRFLGHALSVDGEPRAVDGRDAATDAVSALAAARGAWCVRVHSPRGSRDAVGIVRAWAGETSDES